MVSLKKLHIFGEMRTLRRLERRKGGVRSQGFSASSRRRLVNIINGNISVTHFPPVSPPTVPPIVVSPPNPPPPFHKKASFSSHLPQPDPSLPHARPPLSQAIPPPPALPQNPKNLSLAKPFSSFADLFKNPQPSFPPLQKPFSRFEGILPLPDSGWTKVSYKKKPRAPLLAPPSHPRKPPRCFLCGSISHMANLCPVGDFKCFACNRVGHTSISCPNKTKPPPLSLSSPPLQPPPLFIPQIVLPPSVLANVEEFSSYGFFDIQVGNPSMEELIENLEYHFKVDRWSYKIRRSSPSSFFIQFPKEETLSLACAKDYFDMGTFGGVFSPWSETKGLTAIPKSVYVWVQIFDLPIHLWDSDFLSKLFEEVGEVISFSEDVSFKVNAKDCKILLLVKEVSEIPRSIKFRYNSPDGIHIMEGVVKICVVGKPLPDKKGKCREFLEHFVSKEGLSSSSSATPASLRHTSSEAQRPSVEVPISSPPIPTEVAPSPPADLQDPTPRVTPASPVRMSSPQPVQHVQHPVELVEVIFKGVPLQIAKESWIRLSASFPLANADDMAMAFSSHQTPPIHLHSSSDSLDVASSSAPPPGFEHVKKLSKKKSTKRQLSLLPHRKHLAILKKSIPPGGNKSKPSSSAIFSSHNSIENINDIAINCGIKEPIDRDSLLVIQSQDSVEKLSH